jgi:hypothetical protein
MQGCIAFYVGAGKPLRKTPLKPEERRINAASGSPFLWILSFGEAKESIAAVGPRTDIQKTRRNSDTSNQTSQFPIITLRTRSNSRKLLLTKIKP